MAQSRFHELIALLRGRRSGTGNDGSPQVQRAFWQEFWVLLFIVLAVIGLVSGKGLLVAFGATGMLIVATSWLWNQVALREVYLKRDLPQRRAFVDEEVPITLSVTNGKPVPLGWMHIQDRLPLAVDVLDAKSNVRQEGTYQILEQFTAISWYEKVNWSYTIKCSKRGYYRFGPAIIDSGDIFGFYQSRMVTRDADHLLVYPKVVPMQELGIPAFRALGESRSYVPLHEDLSLPSTVREYRRGDPANRVAWRASARAQRLQVRTFDPSASTAMMLVVAVETTSRRWEGYIPERLERTITAAASIASHAFERQFAVGLFSNGAPVESTRTMRIDPSRSPEQLPQIMEALATIRPVVLRPMTGFLAESARSFPLGSTVVLAAGFLQPELVDSMQTLKQAGHPVVVVYVGDDEPPTMPDGIVLYNLSGYFMRMERDIGYRPA